MQCNIEKRGRKIRRTGGIICCLAGALLALLAFTGTCPFWLAMGPGIGLLAAGGFQLYESHKGWCVVRAMGFKTPF